LSSISINDICNRLSSISVNVICNSLSAIHYLMALNLLHMPFTIWWHSIYYTCHSLSDGTQTIKNVIYYLMEINILQMSHQIVMTCVIAWVPSDSKWHL
jgi:hypothetical protein